MSTEPKRGSAEHKARIEQQLSEYNQLLMTYEEGLKKVTNDQERQAIETNIERVKAELKELNAELHSVDKGNK